MIGKISCVLVVLSLFSSTVFSNETDNKQKAVENVKSEVVDNLSSDISNSSNDEADQDAYLNEKFKSLDEGFYNKAQLEPALCPMWPRC
jgi:hypothetical protein